jgi:transcriptional regulator with XRE-family HTH domain
MGKFGDYIKELRVSKGFSLREFARQLGDKAPSYILDIERGRRNAPSKELLEKMIDVLGIKKEERPMFYDYAKEGKETPIAEDVKETIIENEQVAILCRKIRNKEINIKDLDNFLK